VLKVEILRKTLESYNTITPKTLVKERFYKTGTADNQIILDIRDTQRKTQMEKIDLMKLVINAEAFPEERHYKNKIKDNQGKYGNYCTIRSKNGETIFICERQDEKSDYTVTVFNEFMKIYEKLNVSVPESQIEHVLSNYRKHIFTGSKISIRDKEQLIRRSETVWANRAKIETNKTEEYFENDKTQAEDNGSDLFRTSKSNEKTKSHFGSKLTRIAYNFGSSAMKYFKAGDKKAENKTVPTVPVYEVTQLFAEQR
jgi:hypothetical protein